MAKAKRKAKPARKRKPVKSSASPRPSRPSPPAFGERSRLGPQITAALDALDEMAAILSRELGQRVTIEHRRIRPTPAKGTPWGLVSRLKFAGPVYYDQLGLPASLIEESDSIRRGIGNQRGARIEARYRERGKAKSYAIGPVGSWSAVATALAKETDVEETSVRDRRASLAARYGKGLRPGELPKARDVDEDRVTSLVVWLSEHTIREGGILPVSRAEARAERHAEARDAARLEDDE